LPYSSKWLLGLLERGAPVHASVLALNSAVTTSHGQLDLKELSRDLGVSRGTSHSTFSRASRLTPKAYANVVRFNRALQLARRRRSLWSNIAADCGYFDQSHLIRDFQRYAGRAPSSLLLDRMPDADSIVIA